MDFSWRARKSPILRRSRGAHQANIRASWTNRRKRRFGSLYSTFFQNICRQSNGESGPRPEVYRDDNRTQRSPRSLQFLQRLADCRTRMALECERALTFSEVIEVIKPDPQ